MTVTEPVNSDLDAQLLADPTREELWKSYAAWLKERGDPRGEFIEQTGGGVQPRGEYGNPLFGRAFELLRDHWTRWLGDTPPQFVATSWHHGFVYDLYLKWCEPRDASCRNLFERRSLHFIRSVEVGSGLAVTLEGLSGLPLLSHIKLQGAALPTVRSLYDHHPPSLEDLELVSTSPISIDELAAIVAIPWLATLKRLRVGPLGVTALTQLLAEPDTVRALGSKVVLVADEAGLVTHRAALRAALPETNLQLPPPRNSKFGWSVAAHARLAPANFRELPPIQDVPVDSGCSDGCCYTTHRVGSGAPFEKTTIWTKMSRCMACASSDTRVIYSHHECTYYRRDAESQHHERVEFECKECGRFSTYSNRWFD